PAAGSFFCSAACCDVLAPATPSATDARARDRTLRQTRKWHRLPDIGRGQGNDPHEEPFRTPAVQHSGHGQAASRYPLEQGVSRTVMAHTSPSIVATRP